MVRLFYAFAHLRNPDSWVTAAPPLQHLLGPPVYSQILGRHSGTVFGRRVLSTSRGWMSLLSPPYIGFKTARSNFLSRMQIRRGAELPSNILRSAPLSFYRRDYWMRGTILISVIVGCRPLSIDEQRLDCLCVSKSCMFNSKGGGGWGFLPLHVVSLKRRDWIEQPLATVSWRYWFASIETAAEKVLITANLHCALLLVIETTFFFQSHHSEKGF